MVEIKEELKVLIDRQRKKSFIAEYQDKTTDQEALGILISQYFECNGLAILETTYNALEDSNFHTLNNKIEVMIDDLKGEKVNV